jgi:AcrR family transcriptional regulator
MKRPPKKRRATAKPTSRSQAKERTRELLLESAMRLFAERGLDAPSLDDICARAGLTRGALYVHFADREALLVAVMNRVGQPILDELFGARELGFAGVVARYLAASASGRYPLMPVGGIRPYQLLDACARSPVLREHYVSLVRGSTERIAEFLREGQEASALRADIDAASTATLVVALVAGLETLADLGLPVRLEALAPDLLRLLQR